VGRRFGEKTLPNAPPRLPELIGEETTYIRRRRRRRIVIYV
jgi:hypothetical protein